MQPVWITLYVPRGTAAGVYASTVQIKSGDKPIGSAKLRAEVWDFTLPESTPVYAHYYNDFNKFAANWLDATADDWVKYKTAFRHYVREISRHRGSINLQISYQEGARFDEIVRIMIDEGLEYWWVMWFWGKEFVEKDASTQRQMARQAYDYLKTRDLLDSTIIATWDEPDLRPDHQRERDLWKQHISVLKETGFPKIQADFTWRCKDATSLMEPYPNIWNPQFSYFEPMYYDFLQAQRKKGAMLGFYLTGSGDGREPRQYLPFSLTDMRRLYYYMWQHGVGMAQFWALDVTWRKAGDDPLAMAAGGGYGGGSNSLIYPDRRKDVTRPFLSSLRFEAIRDAIEDYCYLWILERVVERAEKNGDHDLADDGRQVLKETPAKFGDHLRDFELTDPAAYLNARKALAEAIVKVKRSDPEITFPRRKFAWPAVPAQGAVKEL